MLHQQGSYADVANILGYREFVKLVEVSSLICEVKKIFEVKTPYKLINLNYVTGKTHITGQYLSVERQVSGMQMVEPTTTLSKM